MSGNFVTLENSGNLKCSQGILKNIICCYFRDGICNKQHTVIYSLVPLNGYSTTTAASGPPDFGGCNN